MRRTALMFVLAGLVGALVATPVAVYASHQFTDVPNTNPFHADIDWLADAGVTKGCGTDVYCPKENVTREQMAAFMHRLADSQEVDAGELEGLNAGELLRVASATKTSISPEGDIVTADIVAPKPGWLIISGNLHARDVVNRLFQCLIRVDGLSVNGSNQEEQIVGTNQRTTCGTTTVKQVDAGQHTVALFAGPVFGGQDPPQFFNATVWALYVPFDGNGNTP